MAGRHLVLLSVALFVVGGFAGCLGDGKGGAPKEEDDTGGGSDGGGEAVFSQSTGAVDGFVFDVAFAPIAGATVTLLRDGAEKGNITTSDSGSYALSEIEPGSYLLFANKTGFRPKSKPVTITAGGVIHEQFLLEEAPSVTPYIDGPFEFKGFLECSTAPPNGKCTQSFPQQVQNEGSHRPSGSYAFKEGVQAVLLEMVWSPSSGVGANDGGAAGVGGGMTLTTSWNGPQDIGTFSDNALNGEFMRIYMERRLNTDGVWQIFNEEGTATNDWPGFEIGGALAFGGNPNGPNVIAQREFKIYYTAFYHQMAPAGFTGLPEA